MSERCEEVCSELCRGKETTLIWHIKGWNCTDGFDLIKTSSLPMEVGLGVDGKKKGSRLRFYFQDHTKPTQEYNPSYGNLSYTTECLSLFAEDLSTVNDPIAYDLKVEFVDEKSNEVKDENSIGIGKTNQSFKTTGKKVLLKDDFIRLKKTEISGYGTPQTLYQRPADLRLKISVTPVFISFSNSANGNGDGLKADEDTSLCLALKNMFSAEENYVDLKLETKDNMTLSAHKFMLAARSPFLRELIGKQVKKDGFNGTIKLDVNAKPMVVIIHWMYTGELQENAGKCLEEVVDAAIQFQLTGLIKILDKQVITVCNHENMFDLFRVAKKNGMPNAVEDIGNFIKENLNY